MKLLILCREPRLYSCRRLQEAALTDGHRTDILDPNRCLLKLTGKRPHFQLYYQPDKDSEPYRLPVYDAVIPRFGTTSTRMGCAVLRHFEAQNVPCLNSAQAFELARDKWRSLQILMRADIAVPDGILSGCEYQAAQAVEQTGSPTVLKTLCGSQGIGVILAEKPQSAVGMLETLQVAGVPMLLQEFIAEADGADVRCFVMGDRVVASMRRMGRPGEFRANCHRGATAEKILLSEEERAIAINATQALGLDVAGVDLIRSGRGPLVLEVNASPGLEMIEKTSGMDIALQMITYLEKKFRRRHEKVRSEKS